MIGILLISDVSSKAIYQKSSGYFESDVAHDEYHRGTTYRGRPHYWFLGDEFLKVFDNSDIDCQYGSHRTNMLNASLSDLNYQKYNFFTKLWFSNRQKYHKERMMPAEE